MALKKLCPRCHKLIDYNLKMCKECEDKQKDIESKRQKDYDKKIRYADNNVKYAKFYHSVEWIKLSEYVKMSFNGLCIMCLLEDDVINSYDVVHHIVEIKEDWDKRLDSDNLITLCHLHHNKLHRNYTEEKKEHLKELLKRYSELYER